MSAKKPPGNLPRFLPTLTEIVYPPGVPRKTLPVTPTDSTPSEEPVPDAPRKTRRATPALEETVWFVMQRVDLVLERRIREEADAMVHSVVDERIQAASARLRQELEPVIRQAVMDAMTAFAEANGSK